MLFLLLGLVFLGFIVYGVYSITKAYDKDGWVVATATSILCLLGVIGAAIGVNIGAQCQLARLDAFRNANAANYGTAVEMTESLLSDTGTSEGYLVDGSLERMEQGQAVSARIAEWRDAINEYNQEVARMKRLKANIWIGGVYPSANLDYISVE